MAQGGDITAGDGTGGSTCWGDAVIIEKRVKSVLLVALFSAFSCFGCYFVSLSFFNIEREQ